MNETDQIETRLSLKHAPERVWHAITTPEGLNQWFGDRVSMTLEIGAPIVFEWDEYGAASGVIETIEPMKRFSYRWRAHNIPEDEEMTEANSTVVTFELEPHPFGTNLRVLETGFANLPPELRALSYRENEQGWKTELGELVEFLSRQYV